MTGPPGSGKSVLVSSWVKYADPADVVWLSLSADDNCNPSLLDWVVADLVELTHGASMEDPASMEPAAADRDLQRTRPAGDKQILLVIDNIDVLLQPDLVGTFNELVQSLIETVGIVLIGRHWGNLPLHRLGMQVGLTEIDGDDLAFTDQETAEFVSAVGAAGIADQCLQELSSRLEGWAAGVRLASLALPEITDAADVSECLRTDFGLLADYIRKEIFETQPEGIRDFMRRTAVLDIMQPDLCNVVTGRHDSLTVLEGLSRQNLFVRPVGRSDRFRYHTLYREFLCHELALEDVDVETEARHTAARWYEQKGDRVGAMHQLNQAGGVDELFALAVKSTQRGVELRLPPNPDTMLPAGLPASYFEGSPLRMYPLCVSMLLRSDLDGAAKCLRRWESAMGTAIDGVLHRARCELMWAIVDLASMNPEGALQHLASIAPLADRETLGVSHPSDEHERWSRELDDALVATVPMLTARAHLWLGMPQRSRSILLEAYGMDHAAADPLLAGALAVALVAEGGLRQAEELATRALAQAQADGGPEAAVTVDSRFALARVLYERDDLSGSEDQLRAADLICRSNGLESWNAPLECELARLDLARGRAREALRRLEALRRNEPLNEVAATRAEIRGLEVRCRILLGDLLGAEDLFSDWPTRAPAPELMARFYLAAGRPDRAAALLSRPTTEAPSGAPAIERLLLQTRIHLQTGNRRSADHSLQRAVNLAKPEGYVRVFLDEPAQTAELLGSLGTDDADSFVQTLRRKHPRRGQAQRESTPLHIEPLTDRERELLGYLPCHLSQSEIARLMFISANTVKTHIKALYRKLGASSRSEAVSIASRCGLLDNRQTG